MTVFFIMIMISLFIFYLIRTFLPLVFSAYHRHLLAKKMVPIYAQVSTREHLNVSKNIGHYCQLPKTNLNTLASVME